MNLEETWKALSRDELIEIIRMFSKNWLTVDGLWFTLVEDKYGLEAALELDLKMWQRNSLIEAKRIKESLGIKETGLQGVLRTLRFMSFDPAMPYEYCIDNEKTATIWVPRCRPQMARVRSGRGEFPCKPMGLACYEGVVKVIDPSVRVECIFCPPDEHPEEAWCKWRFVQES